MAAYWMRIPVTVHVAIGTESPTFIQRTAGSALGVATQIDFRLFSLSSARSTRAECFSTGALPCYCRKYS